jgi:hypothetical protein
MTAQMLWGGLDNGVGFGEVDDGTNAREIFGGKFWQPDVVSESLRGLGFAKDAQRFIYRKPHHQRAPVTSAGLLLLRIIEATGGCDHQPIATVICIYIALF